MVRAPTLVHGKLSEIRHDGGGIFRGINAPFKATRYHSLVVERKSLPRELDRDRGYRWRRHHGAGAYHGAGARRAISSGKYRLGSRPPDAEKLSRHRRGVEYIDGAARNATPALAREGGTVTVEFRALIGKVATGAALGREEAATAFEQMMAGEATPSQMGALLMALRVRGETVDEITGAVSAMRAKMLRVKAPADAIDVVGTGGDASGSFNISTCAALIVAGAGVPVAKHGNRALSSKSGAADVLAALGVNIDLTPEQIGHCISEAGIGFMFAPSHHPAMKNVGPTRVELGTRTIFNLLGPLSNPAGVRRQMVGVFSKQWTEPLAQVLKNLGAERVWVVHGSDGLDEITTSGPTTVTALEAGEVRSFEISPEDVGLARVKPEALRGGDAPANASAVQDVLEGKKTPFRDVALFNAAAALVVAGKAKDLKAGLDLAAHSVDSGEAEGRLDRLIVVSNDG